MNPKSLEVNFAKSNKVLGPAATAPGGFTLVELLVTLAISSIVLTAVVSLFTILNKSYARQSVAADVQQVARAGVDFMAQSIRMAGLDPTQSVNFDDVFTDATKIRIEFLADLDLDGNLDPGETISYSLVGDELQSSQDAVPLVENVSDLRFTYLDVSGTPFVAPVTAAADRADIRTVIIVLTVEEPAGRGPPVDRTYATEVRCRNLGL